MEQAETYIEMLTECPHCSHTNNVEWAEDNENELKEWTCEECHKDFSYAHPENQYGLGK